MGQATDWDFPGTIKKLVARSGEPVIRQAISAAMRMLGGQFVLGRTMKEALRNAPGTDGEFFKVPKVIER